MYVILFDDTVNKHISRQIKKIMITLKKEMTV